MGSFIFEVRTAEDVAWRSQILAYEDSAFLEANVFLTDDEYTADKMMWVAEVASRLTDCVAAGVYVYRWDQGDVRFRVARAFGDDPITPNAIAHLLELTAFPIRLWAAAYSFRDDPHMLPEIAVEAALIGEGAYSGEGLEKSARRAIMGISVSSELSPMQVEKRKATSPYLKLV
jgi:hypothetical protein